MNVQSSRSHLITTFTLVEVTKSKECIGAKLNLVDLAGSERVKASGVTGDKLKEACSINLVLNKLVSVVDGLCQGKKRSQLGLRDSKLTALLGDSLGGNCKTTLLAMLSPSQNYSRESNNTLKFA